MVLRILVRTVVVLGLIVGLYALYFARMGCSCTPKWKAYRAAMKSDLRNLAMVQGDHFGRQGVFVAGTASSSVDGSRIALANTDFVPSVGVTIAVTAAPGGQWTATARHVATDVTCSVMGDATNVLLPGATRYRIIEPICSR